MKKTLCILLSALLILTLAACSGPGTSNPATPEADATPDTAAPADQDDGDAPAPAADIDPSSITIAVVPQQLGNVVFLPAKEGAEAKAAELGIKVEWVAPVRAEASEQVGVVEGLIEKGVNGIAISCNTPDALKDVLARAISEGIQVCTFDADSPESGRMFYAGTENYQAGVVCAEEMIKLFADSDKDVIRVAQLEGIPGAFDIEARKQGFADTIAGTNIEVVYSGACDDDVDKSIEVIESYTRANGDDIDAWFMSGGWPYVVNPDATPEVNAWKAADPNRKVVTMDIFPTSKAFFEKELIDVAVGQDFYSMGAASVENLYKLVIGEEIQVEQVDEIGAFINTGVQIVNMDNYETEIEEE